MTNSGPNKKVRLSNNPEKANRKPSAWSGLKSSAVWLLATGWFTLSGFAATHPLEPLSTNELRSAIDVLLKENRISTNSFIPIVVLQEPPKEQVLAWRPGMSIRRQAFIVTYDLPNHRTYEAIVDLDHGQVISWRHQPGVEPLQTMGELEASGRILQTNAMWIAALQRRGITNLALVDSTAIPGALIPFRGAENVRLLRAIPFRRQINRLLWEPIEGLSAVVDMTHQKVLEVADHDIIPRSTSSMDFFDPAVRGRREALKPLVTMQPQGANFVVRDHEVVWDRWRFRYSMHPREGLVLHKVGWEEAPGKVRSILYRASLSDLLAPYADTDPAWSWRAFFDESDFGLGHYASTLVRGVTTVAHATLLSEPMPDPKGNGGVLEAADLVDIYERDAGSLWAHSDSEARASAGPRARELVIGYLTTVGNYDYRLQWSFRQDGTIEFHVYLTGIMLTKGTHAKTCAACAAALAGKAG